MMTSESMQNILLPFSSTDMLSLISESDEDENGFLQEQFNLHRGFVDSANVALMELLLLNYVEIADMALIEVLVHKHVEGINEYTQQRSRSSEEQSCTSEDEY